MQFSSVLVVTLASIGFVCSPSSLAAFQVNESASSFYPQNIEKKPIIAYFDSIEKHNQYITQPVKNGFYRILLGRNKEGHYLIQDFFQDTSLPQTSPYWLNAVEGLFQFGVEYIEGPIVGYFRNGQVSFKTQMVDGKYLHPFESFYPTGQIANRTENLKDGETIDQYFYADGKKALEFKYNSDGERTQTKVWHPTGQLLDENQAELVEDEILESIRFDR